MRVILSYFRQHRWQRRALTGLVSLVLGALAAVILYPSVRDHLLIRDLDSDDAQTRRDAGGDLHTLALRSADTLRRLNAAMNTDSDRQFAAIAAILRSLDAFHTPAREGIWIDRLNAIEMSDASVAGPSDIAVRTRWLLLTEILLDGRDNAHVRRAMTAAAADGSREIRQLGAMLSGRLADDKTLTALLTDEDADVAASAAICIASARRQTLAPAVAAMLTEATDLQRVSAAAWACIQFQPTETVKTIANIAADTPDDALRDRLLHVMTLTGPSEWSTNAIGRILDQAAKTKRPPAPMALIAAGRLKVNTAASHVLNVLDWSDSQTPLTEAHLLAALEAAELLNLPIRRQANMICRTLWGRENPLLLVAAARTLGRQLDVSQPPDAPSRETCIETLRAAAKFIGQTATPPAASRPATSPAEEFLTPLPSAAAAVALWLRGEDADDKLVRLTAASDTTLPGDYIAWHCARSSRGDKAWELGQKMLPPLPAPLGQKVFNDNERSAGAMMLALTAGTDAQRRLADDRIARRLEYSRDFYTTGAMQCALLILGRADQQENVRRLLTDLAFPRRRVMTALCATGDRQAMDWLLFNRYLSANDVAALMTTRGISEVISAVASEFPVVQTAGSDDLQLWQVMIMRSYWGVRRATVRLGGLKP